MKELKIYGVEFHGKSGTRTDDARGMVAEVGVDDQTVRNDFDTVLPWGAMRRCNTAIVNGERFPSSFEGDDGFDNVNADVFVYVPLFFYQRAADDSFCKVSMQQHDGFDAPRPTRLPDGGVVVLEGLHALNPRLVEGLPAACGFRLFIEPKTQLEIFATTRLPSRDARLVRRLVRDHQFRKMDPLATFRMWPKVLAGEEKWIDPFRSLADAEFDSALEYELAVLKPYVAGLLARVLLRNRDEVRAQTLSMLFEAIVATDPVKVPGDSILRETIGGSLLEY